MRRRLRPEEARLWRLVASTAHPLPGRTLPTAPETPAKASPAAPSPKPAAPAPRPQAALRRPSHALHGIEPNRERRIALGREEIGARLDLHGYDQDQARAALTRFILAAADEGHRAVLVITGVGRMGGGVLRRRLTDWLHEAPLRSVVAGVATARRRHGGDGAFYIALKRR